MKFHFASVLFLAALSLVNAQGDPKVVGNCVTGKINFNPTRILNNQANSSVIDEKKFDMTIDYGAANVALGPNGATLSLTKIGDGSQAAQGIRMSTTRYILYGKLSVEMSIATVPGVVVTFITMSDRKDEIDWEFTGPVTHSNVFYKGILEFSVHDIILPVENVNQSRIYTLDWKRDSLTWLVDGKPLRTLFRANSTSPMTPRGERWYPETPSQVQISLWDGGASSNAGTRAWAGGPIKWGSETEFSATYKSIDIQCYNDQDMPAQSWPVQPEDVSIDFPPPTNVINGANVNVIDQNGKVRTRSGSSSATASFIVLLSILVFAF